MDLLRAHIGTLEHAADVALDLFGGGEADEHIVLAADVFHDGLVKARARDLMVLFSLAPEP